MKRIFIIAGIFSIAFISCSKSNDAAATANRPAENGRILIRIQNNTADNFLFAAISNITYGGVNAGTISAYKAFDQVIAYPGARIVYGSDTLYAGQPYCGTPPLPMLEDGKYRLEIKNDANGYNQLSAEYIRE